MNDTTTDFSDYENGVKDICSKYGLDDAEINVDSSIGKNQIPVVVNVDGTSMLPTLQDGQKVLVNKSHDIDVGDIVVYIFSLSPLKCREIIPLTRASTPLKSAKTSSLIGQITL
jgi:hypothetical protein